MAKILIVYHDLEKQFFWSGFSDALHHEGYEISESSYFLTNFSSENTSGMLVDLLTGKSKDQFDLVIVFDEYEDILKAIKFLIPTKIPVFYVDVFDEVEVIDGLTWFHGLTLPSEIVEEANKILLK